MGGAGTWCFRCPGGQEYRKVARSPGSEAQACCGLLCASVSSWVAVAVSLALGHTDAPCQGATECPPQNKQSLWSNCEYLFKIFIKGQHKLLLINGPWNSVLGVIKLTRISLGV